MTVPASGVRALLDSEQTRRASDRQIMTLAEVMGARVNIQRDNSPSGRSDVNAAEEPRLSGKDMDLFFDSSNRNATDQNLARLCTLLKERRDIKLRCVHLGPSAITNAGLKNFEGLFVQQLGIRNTAVNGDELADDLSGFRVNEWGTVPELSQAGLLKFLAADNVQSIDISVDLLSPELMSALDGSHLPALGLLGPAKNGWPPHDVFKALSDSPVRKIQFVGPNLPESYLKTLHREMPHLALGQGGERSCTSRQRKGSRCGPQDRW